MRGPDQRLRMNQKSIHIWHLTLDPYSVGCQVGIRPKTVHAYLSKKDPRIDLEDELMYCLEEILV